MSAGDDKRQLGLPSVGAPPRLELAGGAAPAPDRPVVEVVRVGRRLRVLLAVVVPLSPESKFVRFSAALRVEGARYHVKALNPVQPKDRAGYFTVVGPIVEIPPCRTQLQTLDKSQSNLEQSE